MMSTFLTKYNFKRVKLVMKIRQSGYKKLNKNSVGVFIEVKALFLFVKDMHVKNCQGSS